MAAAAMTAASPYLVALRAAAEGEQPLREPKKGGQQQQRKQRREREESEDLNSVGESELCFVCGSLAPAGQAYCSDTCRSQDEAPSPVPALVSSSRRKPLRSEDGSASSPPSSVAAAAESSEEDDIDRLVLGPSLHSYNGVNQSNKKSPFAYPYSYNLTGSSSGSPALLAAKSPTKSPILRPVTSAFATNNPTRLVGGLLSPQYGPVQTARRPSTAPVALPASSSATPTEDLTFRRRYHPEGAKQQQSAANVSPAILASRRRSSNLPSPLLLARNSVSQPMTERSVSSSSSSSSNAGDSSATSERSSSNQYTKPQSAAQASLSRLLGGGTRSPQLKSAASPPPASASLGNKSPSSATLRAHGGAAAANGGRKSLPLTAGGGRHGHLIAAPSAAVGNGHLPSNRRVSEPLSPYYSPSIHSPTSGDPFASAFLQQGPSSSRYSPSSSSSRPTMSASWSAPFIPSSPLASSVATTRPQDYSGWAGFLENRHTSRASPVLSPSAGISTASTSTATKQQQHRRSDGTESGYDAQDEHKDRRLTTSGTATIKKATVSPVTSRRALAEVSNGLRESAQQQQQQKTHATIMKERLAALAHSGNAGIGGSSASSSSSDGSHVQQGGGAGGRTRAAYHYARGGAFKSLLHEDDDDDNDDAEREEEQEEEGSGRRGRRSRQSTVKATQQQQQQQSQQAFAAARSDQQSKSRTRSNGRSTSQEGQYVVTILPSRAQTKPLSTTNRNGKVESAILTSSSEDEEREENSRGRGRQARATSLTTAATERKQLVSPFSALERAAAGLPHHQTPPPPPAVRPASRQAPQEGRGRSMHRRNSSINGQRA